MKKLSLFCFLVFIITLKIHSQKKYDIGIISGGSDNNSIFTGTYIRDLNNLNLEFRNQLNDKWRLNFGLSTGKFRPYDSRLTGYTSSLYSISDTSITYRKSRHYQSMTSIRLGTERTFNKQLFKNPIFKNRVFSYGFDILLGRTKYHTNKFNLTHTYDSLYFPIQLNQYDMFSSNSDQYTSTLFNGAFQFSLKANFPINERLIFSVHSQFSMQCYVKLNEAYDLSIPNHYVNFQTSNLASSTVIDPNIPLLDIQTLSDFILLPSSRLYVGLRYSFGKKKNDVEVPEE